MQNVNNELDELPFFIADVAKPVRKKLICHLISEPTWALPSCELISCKVDGERDGGGREGEGKARWQAGESRLISSHSRNGRKSLVESFQANGHTHFRPLSINVSQTHKLQDMLFKDFFITKISRLRPRGLLRLRSWGHKNRAERRGAPRAKFGSQGVRVVR